jgi:acyl-CoA reductase-like NAD-dependent aldehyde dehydrogenase
MPKVDMGDPLKCAFGSLSSQAHRSKVHSYVELARKAGARVLCGGVIPNMPEVTSETHAIVASHRIAARV